MRYILAFVLLAFYLPALSQNSIFDRYGNIETIAGTGQISDKGVNGWKRSYERKDARQAELSRPHFAMADKAGNIYIADKDAHAIRRIDVTSGKIYTVAGTNEAGDGEDGSASRCQLHEPNGLFVLPNGEFYILDLGNHKIRKVDSTGQIRTVFRDQFGINYGRGLWVNSTEDTIYYCCGTEIRMWTSSGGIDIYADGFEELGNICLDANGNVIATDRDKGKVFRFNRKTKKVDHIAGNGLDEDAAKSSKALDISMDGVRAVWPTGDGGLLLGCHNSHDIWYVNAQGKAKKFVDGKKNAHAGDGEKFNSDGKKISEVRSISIDYKGNILICENDAGFVRIIYAN